LPLGRAEGALERRQDGPAKLEDGAAAVVVGSALYEERFTLAEAQAAVGQR